MFIKTQRCTRNWYAATSVHLFMLKIGNFCSSSAASTCIIEMLYNRGIEAMPSSRDDLQFLSNITVCSPAPLRCGLFAKRMLLHPYCHQRFYFSAKCPLCDMTFFENLSGGNSLFCILSSPLSPSS